MKEKLLISLISIVIILATGALFQYGEKIMDENLESGYSVFHFKSTNTTIDNRFEDTSSLELVIRNLEQQTNTYTLSFFINGEMIQETEKKVVQGETNTVEIPENLKEKIPTINQKDRINYSIEIKWNSSKKKLTKKITILDEK